MNILVTGSSGFIGSTIVEYLAAQGHNVFCFQRNQSISNIKYINFNYISEFDITNKNVEHPIDIIIHCAWGSVRGVERNNLDQQKENLVFSMKIAEIALALKVKKFIALGSQAEYGIINSKIDEQTPFKPNTAYGEYKIHTHEALTRLFQGLEIEFVWLRLFSVYGIGDFGESLVMSTIRKMINKERVLLTKCEQNWDFLYIEDFCFLINSLIKMKDIAGVYNIASGVSRPLKEYVEIIRKQTNYPGCVEYGAVAYNEFNNVYLDVDISKIKAIIPEFPKIDFEEGIRRIVSIS